MSSSRVLIKTVSSVSLVFGLDWFAILGGTVAREVRRIARQHKATHAVHAGDDAASAGITALQPGKRGTTLYSAAQLVAQRFTTGTVAMVVKLDHDRWWLVAIHEGAVIARTDHICASHTEAAALIGQLHQAYPALTVLDDSDGLPSVSDLAADLYTEAELQRVAYGGRISFSPFQWLVLAVLLAFLLRWIWSVIDFSGQHEHSSAQGVTPDMAWSTALHSMTNSHWVHGVAGISDLLLSLYALPVELAGWRLLHIDCVSHYSKWQCHADYNRDDPDASNEHFLALAPAQWDVSFTPLEQVRARWELASAGLSLAQTTLQTAARNERYLFSRLQAIRPAFALVRIDAPAVLTIPAPRDEHGHPVPPPEALPQFRTRALRIQAPLRSLSLLLPYCDAMAWQRLVINLDSGISPDLTHSRLNVLLQGVLYEQE